MRGYFTRSLTTLVILAIIFASDAARPTFALAQGLEIVEVEGQPLAANIVPSRRWLVSCWVRRYQQR